MPDDKNPYRFDLSAELNEAKSAFLSDMEAAAEQVKDQLKAAAEKEQKEAQAARSKKISAAVVAVAAIVIFLVAYLVVFGKPNDSATAQNQTRYPKAQVKIENLAAPTPKPTVAAPRQSTTPAPSQQDSQIVDRPSDDYEQPGQDSGM